MDPKIWGPHFWLYLHSMSFSYAEKKDQPTSSEKKHMFNFLESIKHTLPCTCKNNYKEFFDKHPPRLDSRRQLFEWIVDLHNSVNEEFNKIMEKKNRPDLYKRIFTYLEVENMYKKMYKNI